MVMFHDQIPYAVSYQRGEIQKKLLEELTKNADKLEEIDFKHAEKLVASRLTPL
jgi:kynurenine 3-monooxygenase